ncbi:MAG: DUF1553 domain-containing protein [Fuerstiella sp.]
MNSRTATPRVNLSRTAMVLTAVLMMLRLPAVHADDRAQQLEFFEARIRPVLVRHCYECHSAESDEVRGGLQLDSAAGLKKGGDSGPAVIAGQPDESPLIQALRYESSEMPPSGRLPSHIVRDFEKWVAMGMPDPRTEPLTTSTSGTTIDIAQGRQFWAFQPFQDHAPPSAGNATDESPSSIDAFIRAKLQQSGVQATPPANRTTLVRRLFFDLIGLPPSESDLRTALADESSEAVSDLANQLLDSPQFGVHWGRHWLDVARYADSNGSDFNATFHNAWKYRDYVVEFMNHDRPFHEFVREQIAGDLLPYQDESERSRQLIATGFLMLGPKMLSERDKDKLTMDVVDEQINTVGSAFLGMTLGCARCHDHKFDPIPTRDYYALAGIFRSTRTLQGESQKYVSTWPRTPLPAAAEQIAAIEAFETKQKSLQSAITAEKKQLAELQQQHQLNSRGQVDDTQARLIGDWKASKLTPRFIGQGYVHDNRKDKGEKSAEFLWTPPSDGIFEVRLSYTHHASRADNVPVLIRHAQGEDTVLLDQTRPPEIDDLFAAVGRFRFQQDKAASVLVSNAGTTGFVIVDAVQFVEVDSNGEIRQLAEESSGPEQEQMTRLKTSIEKLESELAALKKDPPEPLPKALAVQDLPEVQDCQICVRGEHRNLGARVPRGFLQVVSPDQTPVINEQTSGRRQLADWIASPENPLTARVIVNRVWQHLLGEGIVRSVDNFGRLGERPSHPELLDHLASRFVTPADQQTDHGAAGFGWSIKSLIREIVLTEVYQRSSHHIESSWQEDPDNRLLWKAHRRRLPAESLRDAILAISGRLDLSPGGSPVQGLGTLVKTNDANADDYQREETSRRSLYMPIIRNELPSILSVFDFADPDLVVGRRPVTNVPAQALFLLNSPFVMESARRTADRLCQQPSDTVASVVQRTYLEVLSRKPTSEELSRALRFLNFPDADATVATADAMAEQNAGEPVVTRLARFVHVLLASTEFRMLN